MDTPARRDSAYPALSRKEQRRNRKKDRNDLKRAIKEMQKKYRSDLGKGDETYNPEFNAMFAGKFREHGINNHPLLKSLYVRTHLLSKQRASKLAKQIVGKCTHEDIGEILGNIRLAESGVDLELLLQDKINGDKFAEYRSKREGTRERAREGTRERARERTRDRTRERKPQSQQRSSEDRQRGEQESLSQEEIQLGIDVRDAVNEALGQSTIIVDLNDLKKKEYSNLSDFLYNETVDKSEPVGSFMLSKDTYFGSEERQELLRKLGVEPQEIEGREYVSFEKFINAFTERMENRKESPVHAQPAEIPERNSEQRRDPTSEEAQHRNPTSEEAQHRASESASRRTSQGASRRTSEDTPRRTSQGAPRQDASLRRTSKGTPSQDASRRTSEDTPRRASQGASRGTSKGTPRAPVGKGYEQLHYPGGRGRDYRVPVPEGYNGETYKKKGRPIAQPAEQRNVSQTRALSSSAKPQQRRQPYPPKGTPLYGGQRTGRRYSHVTTFGLENNEDRSNSSR